MKVAELDLTDTATLDDAYKLTQHGIYEDYPNWVEGAKAYEGNVVVDKARSTSIGDIIRKDGKDYLVDNVGFLEVV